MVSPGLSSIPANIPPNITTLAPAANDFAISPLYRIPPSAIIGILCFKPTLAQSITAESCGTPIPATIRVVQLDPAPIPTFTQSAPALIKSSVASAVATLPAIKSSLGNAFLIFFTNSKTYSE